MQLTSRNQQQQQQQQHQIVQSQRATLIQISNILFSIYPCNYSLSILSFPTPSTLPPTIVEELQRVKNEVPQLSPRDISQTDSNGSFLTWETLQRFRGTDEMCVLKVIINK
jgi:hypothetical protein